MAGIENNNNNNNNNTTFDGTDDCCLPPHLFKSSSTMKSLDLGPSIFNSMESNSMSMDDYLASLRSVEFDMQHTYPSLGGSLELPDNTLFDGRSWARGVPSLSGLPYGSSEEGKEQKSTDSWKSMFMEALTKTSTPQPMFYLPVAEQTSLPELNLDPRIIEPVTSNNNCNDCNDTAPKAKLTELNLAQSSVEPVQSPNSLGTPQSATKRKKSKSNKRKRVYKSRRVVPEDKEYVDHYNEYDVICGRGARTNKHPGNKFYLGLVEDRKSHYRQASDKEKRTIVLEVLGTIHERGGRILELEKGTKRWYVSHEKMAYTKVGQALRDDNDEAARAAKRAKYGSSRKTKASSHKHA